MAAPYWIDVQDSEVIQAMNRMNQASINPGPALRAIGEALLPLVKRSFETSTDPWGNRWAPNSQATYEQFLKGRAGTFSKKTGRITAKGSTLAMNKKPLFGHSYDLFRQFHYQVQNSSLWFYNSMVYAAIQNFGGTKAQFPNLWGDIPARPFMPVNAAGQMAPAAQAVVLEIIQEHLLGSGA